MCDVVRATELPSSATSARGSAVIPVNEPIEKLHRDAVEAGWEHSYDSTPYENLRTLTELVERDHLDADRRVIERFAFRFICGYGPASAPQALDRLGVEE